MSYLDAHVGVDFPVEIDISEPIIGKGPNNLSLCLYKHSYSPI